MKVILNLFLVKKEDQRDYGTNGGGIGTHGSGSEE